MTTEALYNEVVQIISKYSRAEEAMKGVSRDSSILGDLKVNSTRFVDILIEFEDKYIFKLATMMQIKLKQLVTLLIY